MALGTIITAKGKRLDFAELVRKARTPINSTVDMKDKVVRQTPPAGTVRARGHLPAHTDIAVPNYDKVIVSEQQSVPGKSMVDYTSITIAEAKHSKPRTDPTQSANEALVEILDQDAVKKPRGKRES